jgi:hypothetical protein
MSAPRATLAEYRELRSGLETVAALMGSIPPAFWGCSDVHWDRTLAAMSQTIARLRRLSQEYGAEVVITEAGTGE